MSTAAQPARRALTATEVITRLTQLNGDQVQGWRVIDNALEKTFRFADFHRTMAFVNAVAYIAHAQDHHPDLQLGYGHCTVRWARKTPAVWPMNSCAVMSNPVRPSGARITSPASTT